MMTNDFEDIDFLSEYDVHITLLDIAFREDEEVFENIILIIKFQIRLKLKP